MTEGKIIVAGIGPGGVEDITPSVMDALRICDVVIGYKPYLKYVTHVLREDCVLVDSGMRQEQQRAAAAFDYAASGKVVCVVSSGDAGIYGMAPLIYEMSKQRNEDVDIIVLPGISAFQKAAALLGAPIGHDVCLISLSDLMTPWQVIEKRVKAAATADFVTAVYNPRSHGRYWQLQRLLEIFLEERDPATPVGYVRNAGRDDSSVCVTTLADFNPTDVDMFTVVIIGNSQSYRYNGRIVTPRGYYRDTTSEGKNMGQNIMIQSFSTIMREMSNPNVPLWRLWPTLHAIHTTADFEMEKLLWMDEAAVATMYDRVLNGKITTIVTDVTMVASGIRKGALERLGINVVCYINDPRVKEMAENEGITRAMAAMRVASSEYPEALYAFGNAPTALLELCSLMRKGKCRPMGVIGSPVGFVHVEESKHALKTFTDVPKIIVEGRKGGSNLAATLVNSVLTFNDAELLNPGRDV